MKIKFIVGIIVLASVILINACEDKAVTPVTSLTNCDTTNLTYSSDSNSSMQAIINVQCGATTKSCHSPGSISTYDYSTYSGVYSNYSKGLLYQALFGGGPRMPLTPMPGWDPSCMLPKFKAWMDRGCPQ